MNENKQSNIVEAGIKAYNIYKKIALISSIAGPLSFFVIFIVIFVCIVLLIIGVKYGSFGDSNSLASDNMCVTYQTVDEVCKSMTVNGETMSIDDYVAGVIQGEFGGANLETKKAQAIAARSYAIASSKKDDNGNCNMGTASESSQVYASNPSESSIQAANETSGMVLVDENGNIARSEYSSNSLPAAYDSYGDTITMSERNLEIPRTWFSANKTCSTEKLNTATKKKDSYGRIVYGCGHGRGMGQIAAKYLSEEKGYTYTEILEYFYGKDSEYKWTIGSSSGEQSGNCNLSTLDSYNFGHKGLKILDKTLTSNEISTLNTYINGEINKAGYGTGNGVAAAGQSLVYGLEQMGYYLGYCWGGDRSSIGVGTSWGKTSSNCNSPYASHKYYGMDCSGFVGWSIRTACKPNHIAKSTHDLKYGPSISVTEAKPGDLMLKAGSHVRLVIKNNGDGTVITAEEGGTYGDLGFNKYSTESGYVFIDMSEWYKNNCSDTNPTTNVIQ